YFDILSIVEHPAFIEFYNDLIKEGTIGEAGELKNNRSSVLGDIIEITPKENYREYDLFFPVIVQDKEEFLADSKIPIDGLLPFTAFPLDKLKHFAQTVGDTFVSNEITVGTQFGRYKVSEAVFNAKSYNEFISRIVGVLSAAVEKPAEGKPRRFLLCRCMRQNSPPLSIRIYAHACLMARLTRL
uniref:hypothetical protein n=1 Tax=Treponema endosymbiont of Eucomonympha sp. TaxID=1580831 RepID=UPI000A80D8B5